MLLLDHEPRLAAMDAAHLQLRLRPPESLVAYFFELRIPRRAICSSARLLLLLRVHDTLYATKMSSQGVLWLSPLLGVASRYLGAFANPRTSRRAVRVSNRSRERPGNLDRCP